MTNSTLPFPRWRYIPGGGEEADHETLAIAKSLVPARFEQMVPANHAALRYGLTLNDAGFFWECHEILEALWKAAPKGGHDRLLLRAYIQTANANLKDAMARPGAADRLRAEALAELDELSCRGPAEPGSFAGEFDTADLRLRLSRPSHS